MYEQTYQKRVLKQSEEPKKRRSFPWKKLLIIFFALAFFVGIIYLIRLPIFQVTTVIVEGTNVGDPDAVSQFVIDELSGTRLKILPRSSIFMLSTDLLERDIKANFTRFSEVSVNRENTKTLSVHVKEYEGKYVWCAQGANPGECFFMDEKGVVFAPSPYFSGSAYAKVFVGEKAELPFSPISENELYILEALIEKLPQISINPYTFQFVSPEELHVFFSHNNLDTKIIIDTTEDINKTVNVLSAGMRALSFSNEYKSSRRLEYIDLRFSNKMVYKFQ